jgi:hypothetical protein
VIDKNEVRKRTKRTREGNEEERSYVKEAKADGSCLKIYYFIGKRSSEVIYYYQIPCLTCYNM